MDDESIWNEIITIKEIIENNNDNLELVLENVARLQELLIANPQFLGKPANIFRFYPPKRILDNTYIIDITPKLNEYAGTIFSQSMGAEEKVNYLVQKARAMLQDKNMTSRGERYDLSVDNPRGECVNSTKLIVNEGKSKGISINGYSTKEMGLAKNDNHCFSIATIDGKKYILDATYSQFFALTYSVNVNKTKQDAGIYMVVDEERKSVAQQLLKDGFIEATPENLKAYLDGFVMADRKSLDDTQISAEEYFTLLEEKAIQYEEDDMVEIKRKIDSRYKDFMGRDSSPKISKEWFYDFCTILQEQGYSKAEIESILKNMMSQDSLENMSKIGMLKNFGTTYVKNEKAFFEYLRTILEKSDKKYLDDGLQYAKNEIESSGNFIDSFIKYVVITNFEDLKVQSSIDKMAQEGDTAILSCNLGNFELCKIDCELEENRINFDELHTRKNLTRTKIGTVLFRHLQGEVHTYFPDKDLYANRVRKVNVDGIRFYERMGGEVSDYGNETQVMVTYKKEKMEELSKVPIEPPVLKTDKEKSNSITGKKVLVSSTDIAKVSKEYDTTIAEVGTPEDYIESIEDIEVVSDKSKDKGDI